MKNPRRPALTREQFRSRLAAIGMTQVEFAERVGTNHTTVSGWGAAGQPAIPGYVPALLDAWEAVGEAAAWERTATD